MLTNSQMDSRATFACLLLGQPTLRRRLRRQPVDLRRESSPRRARRDVRMTTTAPSLELPVPDGWPVPPDQAAYHGLPGAIVSKLAPNTEADPVAILTQLLIACGAMI